MTDRKGLLRVPIDTEDRPIVASESLLARFLMRELESSDGTNQLLTLFEGSQQSVARRLSRCSLLPPVTISSRATRRPPAPKPPTSTG
jgi:hypothetical protein